MSGQKNSHTDTSNVKGVFCRTVSAAVSPYSSCIHRRRLQMPRWVSMTHLGVPVDPDV